MYFATPLDRARGIFGLVHLKYPKVSSGKTMLSGIVLLRNSSGNVLMILDYYCYVRPLNAQTLLVWHAKQTRPGSYLCTETTEFSILNLNRLKPISDVPKAIKSLKADKCYVHFDDTEATNFSLQTGLMTREVGMTFPTELNQIDELLVLGTTAAMQQSGDSQVGHLRLFVLCPKESRVEVYPQDWFNEGNLDYGYQWVTRVARDSISGKIFGEGIRISQFVLDSSLRQVEHWFSDDPFYPK